MTKRIIAVAVSAVAALSFAALTTPAQALTGDGAPATPCDDGAAWTWTVSNPARYGANPHEVVIGLSEATRTVTIHAPAGCAFNTGDRWQVYSGKAGFSASGSISASEDGDTEDSDSVAFEVPDSNTIAGDEIGVRLRVSDPTTAGWEVDKSSSVPTITLLRRSELKYKSTPNRINFAEPYQADQPVRSGGDLIRASWSSKSYVGYSGRPVDIQTRDDVAGSAYGTVQEVTTGTGGAVRSSFVVSDPGAPNPGDTFIARAKYDGNGTTSANVSTGDRVAPATP